MQPHSMRKILELLVTQNRRETAGKTARQLGLESYPKVSRTPRLPPEIVLILVVYRLVHRWGYNGQRLTETLLSPTAP